MLSLEAPAVALVWTASLARLHGSKLPPGVLPGLALVVWVIYLLDRVLDTLGQPEAELDERHRFYLRHRLWIAGLAVPAGAAAAVWLAFWRIPAGLLVEALVLVPAVAFYLAVYTGARTRSLRRLALWGGPAMMLALHALPLSSGAKIAGSALVLALALLAWSSRLRGWVQNLLRKESAAGVIFALGCTTFARFSHQGADDPVHWLELMLLAFLFTGNLTVIAQQETPHADRRGQGVFLIGSAVFCAVLGHGGFFGGSSESLRAISLLVIAGLLLHLLLWNAARHRSAEIFRVLADAALLLPPAWVWLR